MLPNKERHKCCREKEPQRLLKISVARGKPPLEMGGFCVLPGTFVLCYY